MPCAGRVRVGRGRGVRCGVALVILRERVGHEPRTRNRPNRRADQERAATFIVRAHADLLPLRYEFRLPG